jgi:non-ribosomal peptide synthetase component F
MSFRALIGGVTKVVRDAVAHSALTFDKVVEAVRPPRDSGRTPLFQVNFRAPRSPYPVLRLPGLEIGPPQYADNGTSKFDLSLEIECSRGEHCYFEYRTDLFAESTIAQMERDYEEALAWLIANPDVPAGSIPLVSKINAKFRHAGEHRC